MDLSRELSPDRCPGQISWHYDRAEIIADGVVHAIGVCLGLLGAVTIVVISINTEQVDVAPIVLRGTKNEPVLVCRTARAEVLRPFAAS